MLIVHLFLTFRNMRYFKWQHKTEFLFENPSYFRLHIIMSKYSVRQRGSFQHPVSIWLVCISADIYCPSVYVSNSLMTTDKGIALSIYKLYLLPYNQRYLLECSLRQITFKIKKRNWFFCYFNIVPHAASLWLNLKHFNALFLFAADQKWSLYSSQS